MKHGLADGLARVRERVETLRGRSGGSGDRYVLLPAGAGRRRRLAEFGAVAAVAAVVLAFVGATVVLRPASSEAPAPDGPGLPAPTEVTASLTGSGPPTASIPAVLVPVPSGRTTPGPGRRPSASTTPGGSATPTPPSTTRPSVPVPTVTKPPGTTPPSSPASPTPTDTDTATPTPTATTPPPIILP